MLICYGSNNYFEFSAQNFFRWIVKDGKLSEVYWYICGVAANIPDETEIYQLRVSKYINIYIHKIYQIKKIYQLICSPSWYSRTAVYCTKSQKSIKYYSEKRRRLQHFLGNFWQVVFYGIYKSFGTFGIFLNHFPFGTPLQSILFTVPDEMCQVMRIAMAGVCYRFR